MSPGQHDAGTSVEITITGTGFAPGSTARARLTSASEELGFKALYVQALQSFGLRLRVTPDANRDMGMAAVRRDVNVVDFDGKQTRIGHFKADELDQLLPHRFRYSPDSPFVHKTGWWMLDIRCWLAWRAAAGFRGGDGF